MANGLTVSAVKPTVGSTAGAGPERQLYEAQLTPFCAVAVSLPQRLHPLRASSNHRPLADLRSINSSAWKQSLSGSHRSFRCAADSKGQDAGDRRCGRQIERQTKPRNHCGMPALRTFG